MEQIDYTSPVTKINGKCQHNCAALPELNGIREAIAKNDIFTINLENQP